MLPGMLRRQVGTPGCSRILRDVRAELVRSAVDAEVLVPSADSPRARLTQALEAGELREVEVLWPDHQGHPRGKRITAEGFLERASGQGFAFCDAALCWDVTGDVKEGLRLSGWDTGFPDLFAVPDLDSYRAVPWRPGVGQVVCDVVGHDRELVRAAPRSVLGRVLERLRRLDYEAKVGAEIEFHILDQAGAPYRDGVQCHSLQKAGELEPVLDEIVTGLTGFVEIEGANTEYGAGQAEINLHYGPALEAADQASRLKHGTRELARRAGAQATFIAKPFGDEAPGGSGPGESVCDQGALASNLAAGIEVARADATIVEILGEDALHDYATLVMCEWETFLSAVSDWDRQRYLKLI